MTLSISWGVAVRKLLHAGICFLLVRALGIASIAMGEMLHIHSCYLQGTSLIVHVYIYSFKNVPIWLWHPVGGAAMSPLRSSICLDCISSDLVSCCFPVLSISAKLLGTICCHLPSSRNVASCPSCKWGFCLSVLRSRSICCLSIHCLLFQVAFLFLSRPHTPPETTGTVVSFYLRVINLGLVQWQLE